MSRLLFSTVVLTALFGICDAHAGAVRTGFDASTLAPNDDGSTGLVSLGFTVDFYGLTFTQAYVNNNGNITFDAALWTYTPFDLTSTGRQIIAPFFADVDTRSGGNPTRYGAGTVDGYPAWGVSWIDVNCYQAGWVSPYGYNTFQLVLIDRSDIAAGDFDIEFNYDTIAWEAGTASGSDYRCLGGATARAGYSNGTGDADTFYELPGSGIAGAFLDGGPSSTALVWNSLNSEVLGRYVFQARNGTVLPPCTDGDADGVCDTDDNCPADGNADQADADLDAVGDACDNCVDDVNADQADTDADGVGDVCDNCALTANADQADADADTWGDACDNCAATANADQADFDADDVGDVCDNCADDANADQSDVDGDLYGDVCDNCPDDANAVQTDTDADGAGDTCDVCPLDPYDDADADSVCGDVDWCPDTWESDLLAGVPAVRLGTNRWADLDGDGVFDTTPPNGEGPGFSFDVVDTAGCDCAQIIDALALGNGHTKYGCSNSAMLDWVELVTE